MIIMKYPFLCEKGWITPEARDENKNNALYKEIRKFSFYAVVKLKKVC